MKKLAPLENRLAPNKQNSVKHELKRDEEKLHESKIESSVHITDTAEEKAGPPSHDLFYKKDSER